MDTTLQTQTIQCYRKVFASTMTAEETGESVVPDKMPDIGMIAHTGACVLLRSKDVSDGTLRLQGEIAVSVLYLPDGEAGVRALRLSLPVTVQFEGAEITQSSIPQASMRLRGVETRMLNPRKILVKAEVESEAACYERSQLVCCTGLADQAGGEAVQLRRTDARFSVVSSVCERTFVVTDEYPLPAGSGDAGEVVWKNAQFRVEDVKTIANKLIIKGTVLSDVLYTTADGLTETVSFPTMFSQILETDSEEVSPDARLTIMPTGMYYELQHTDAGAKLTMEVHAVCQAEAMTRHEMAFVSDAYSNRWDCQVDYAPMSVRTRTKESTLRETVRESIPFRSPVSAVRFALCAVGPVTMEEKGVSARVDIAVCAGGENGTEECAGKRIQVRFTGEDPAGARLRAEGVRCTDVYAVPAGNAVEVRFAAEADLRMESDCTLETVSAVRLAEDHPLVSDRPSLTVVRAAGPLWDIARKYGSTVDLIRQVNGVEEETVAAGSLLFVPRERF